ncbi:hypothetical protein SAMD00019534_102390 [Acytostelium subglobosum LB1]|uniref:hypothetical protein n=1 Tax=Acytostelium subglobosum LB1 TaxID=1410327 RepID=UPI000644CD38|nr:hypothetical protein SAMD00019534_102390 [Acytostelium subglobosum LB1]GAM27064.1 hypothetical protein SAMD00019534_102390 [Acytostelium subglobosum LB1]|eukprot:XP_012749944.1 hypothetical protein SAMD00019534_102390 [Acytostelium subglobosum LB1]
MSSSLTEAETEKFRTLFNVFDRRGDGKIDMIDLAMTMTSLENWGEVVSGLSATTLMKEVDTNHDGSIEFDELLKVMENAKQSGTNTGFASVVEMVERATLLRDNTVKEDVRFAIINWINTVLANDTDLKDRLPVSTESDAFVTACHDGLLLCKLINIVVPNTIEERVLNKQDLTDVRIKENNVLCIYSARAIGCCVDEIKATDLIQGNSQVILGLAWQIIQIGLFEKINLINHPELRRLLKDGETNDVLLRSTEDILLRWFNFHLHAAGHLRKVNNFTHDIKDSECYTILLKQIAPKDVNLNKTLELLPERRAELVLENAEKIGCRQFLRPRDIVSGSLKLNLAFVANLFNKYPALEPVDQAAITPETRQERIYRNWMNSLNTKPVINNLHEGCRDAIAPINIVDRIFPGLVDQKKVSYPPFRSEAKMIENCDYLISLTKMVKYSVIGLLGPDIYNKNIYTLLSIVMQLMRSYYIVPLMEGVKVPNEEGILEMVNQKLKAKISGFNDTGLCTGRALLELIEAIRPGSVDQSLVTSSGSAEDNLLNAKLAISCARKIGAIVYAFPEDIVEVKAKVMLTIFAGVIAVERRN